MADISLLRFLKRRLAKRWTPAEISPLRWYEFDDLSSLRQNSNGTTAVVNANDPVGYAINKGSGNVAVIQGTAANRPQRKTDLGYSTIRFDGTNDYLGDSSGGLYTAGSSWIFFSHKMASSAVVSVISGEYDSAAVFTAYDFRRNSSDIDDFKAFIRDSAGNAIVNTTTIFPTVFDNVMKVIGVVDNGSSLTAYVNGIAGTPVNYTRSGTLVPNKFALGANTASTASGFLTGDMQRFVAGTGTLSAIQRRELVSYLGRGVELLI